MLIFWCHLQPNLARHRLEHGSDSGETPSFLLFETTNLPPPKIKRRCDAKLHPVAHLPLNEGKAVVPLLHLRVDVRSCHASKIFCITWNPKAGWKRVENLDVLHFAMLFRHLRQTLHGFEKFQTLGIEADYILHIFRWRKKHVHDSPGFSRGERFLHRARSDDASSDGVRGARSIFRLLLQEDPPLGAPFARRLGGAHSKLHTSPRWNRFGRKMKIDVQSFKFCFERRFFSILVF